MYLSAVKGEACYLASIVLQFYNSTIHLGDVFIQSDVHLSAIKQSSSLTGCKCLHTGKDSADRTEFGNFFLQWGTTKEKSLASDLGACCVLFLSKVNQLYAV